jgi:hypothetical protein
VQDEWSVRQAAVEKELSVQTVQGKIACNIWILIWTLCILFCVTLIYSIPVSHKLWLTGILYIICNMNLDTFYNLSHSCQLQFYSVVCTQVHDGKD